MGVGLGTAERHFLCLVFVYIAKYYVHVFFMVSQEEQAAKMKAEKIRVALEKIKEAQIKKVGATSVA